ncbi:MAG: NUDIX domain-containing protein [Aureliella sp.]
MRRHGPWTITQSAKIYEDSWLRLDLDQVIRPDGLPGTYTTVQLKPGVTVIALDEQQNVHLTSEFHYAVGRVTLEGVSGGIEPHEPPLVCAKRELVEELGIIASQWTHLGAVDPFTGSIRSPVDLYLAEQLAFTDASPEGSELIERVSMPLAEAIEHVMDNRITHAPSCVALLKIWHRRQQS